MHLVSVKFTLYHHHHHFHSSPWPLWCLSFWVYRWLLLGAPFPDGRPHTYDNHDNMMTIVIMMMISIIVFKLHEWFVPGARSIVCASRLKHCQHPHPSKRGTMMMTIRWFPSKSLDPVTIMMNWWYLVWWRMKINQFHPSCYSASICKCLTCFHSFKISLVSLTTASAFVVCFVQSFWLGFVPPSHFCIFQSEFNLQCSPFVPQTNPLLPFSSELQWASQSDWVTIVFPMMMMMMTMMMVITIMMVITMKMVITMMLGDLYIIGKFCVSVCNEKVTKFFSLPNYF